jgi:hypothetical protein
MPLLEFLSRPLLFSGLLMPPSLTLGLVLATVGVVFWLNIFFLGEGVILLFLELLTSYILR